MKVKESELKAEWLDDIWREREFIQGLLNVANEKYEAMSIRLMEEGMSENTEEWLFDFVYNESEVNYFDEWLFDKGMLNEDKK